MNIEEFRDYCLSFPDTTESTPFDSFYRNKNHSFHTFFVGEKMFCYFDMDTFDSCTIKCDPDKISELKENYQGIDKPYNGNPKYWISVAFNCDVPDTKLKELVKQSYELVAEKASKKKVKS